MLYFLYLGICQTGCKLQYGYRLSGQLIKHLYEVTLNYCQEYCLHYTNKSCIRYVYNNNCVTTNTCDCELFSSYNGNDFFFLGAVKRVKSEPSTTFFPFFSRFFYDLVNFFVKNGRPIV